MTMHTGLIGLQETLTNKWSTQETLDKYRLVVWEVASSSPEPGAAEPRAETRCPLSNLASFRVGRAWEAQVARPRRLHAPCRRLALQGLTAPAHSGSVGGNPARERAKGAGSSVSHALPPLRAYCDGSRFYSLRRGR